MAKGQWMYTGIVDDTGPFSSVIYLINQLITGNSLWSFRIIAFLVIFFQIFYTNHILIKFNAFEENNYLPAFVMTILFQLSFDFMTLSPALLGSTFILLSFGQLLNQSSINQNTPSSILLLGLYGGIAFCFHFPYLVFFPFLILSGIFINGFSFQQLSLAFTGYLLPIITCALFYFLIDGLQPFLDIYIFLSRKLEMIFHISYWDLLFIFTLPVLLALIGYFRNNLLRRMNVNQQKQNQLFLIYLLFSLSVFSFFNRLAPYQFISLLPPLTYFINHILIVAQKKHIQTILFYTYFLVFPFIAYSWVFYKKNDPTFKTYLVAPEEKHKLPENASVWVFGHDLNYYHGSALASPYLNYPLSKIYLGNLKEPEKLMHIYNSLNEAQPDFIIDEEGLFNQLRKKINMLNEKYNETGEGIFGLSK